MSRKGPTEAIYKFSFISEQSIHWRPKCLGWQAYLVKQAQEKWACDFHDDARPLSFQLQVAEVISWIS